MIKEAVQDIPEEHRDSASIYIDTEYDDYGDGKHLEFTLNYARPETEKERNIREQKEETSRVERENWERQQFEALKKKFEK
jgi:hypothetical protein